MVDRVICTPATLELIALLKQQYGQELMFHQSGGCCDNSAANCYLLEGNTGKAFHTRSRLFTDTEWAELQAAGLV